MLGRRHHQKLDRTGTIVGLKGDNYVVRWDGNAKETVNPLKFAAIRRASSRVSAAKRTPAVKPLGVYRPLLRLGFGPSSKGCSGDGEPPSPPNCSDLRARPPGDNNYTLGRGDYPFVSSQSGRNTDSEAELLDGARLIQFMIAGVDFIPLGELPKGVPVATNGWWLSPS